MKMCGVFIDDLRLGGGLLNARVKPGLDRRKRGDRNPRIVLAVIRALLFKPSPR